MAEIDLAESEDVRPLVGVLVREQRATEGLRMASALSLGDNDVEVILTGSSLSQDEEVDLHLDSLDLEEVAVFATFADPRVEQTQWSELARRIVGYDHVITF